MFTTLLAGLLGCAVLAVILLALEAVRWACRAGRRAVARRLARRSARLPGIPVDEESLR
jgi:hypothetical protein